MSTPDTTTIHRPRTPENVITVGAAAPPVFPTSNHTTPVPNGPENANTGAVPHPGAAAEPPAGQNPPRDTAAGQVGGEPGKVPHERNIGAAGEPGNVHVDMNIGAPGELPAVAMLTANGQRDSHAVVLATGQRNTNPRAGQPYGRITWPEVFALADTPGNVTKDRARLVILSTYTEADGRTHDVQRERGTYWGLAVDVDTGNPSLDTVVAAVRGAIGNARALFYSSSGARPDNRKWRVLVPLATPVAGADYADTQAALFGLLERAGVACDVALARPGQPVFLPNVPPDKRGPDGRPLFYTSCVVPGPVLELVDGHQLVAERAAIRERRAAADAAAAARAERYRAERLAHVVATGDTFEPLEHFNTTHTVAELLARYGFKRGRGNHWAHPDTTTGSFATEDRGDHWVCLSAWAHNENVGRTSRSGHRFGDAWDLFVAYEHGGDRAAAFREYARAVRPDWRPPATATPVVDELPPPARVEEIRTPPTVPVEEIREAVAEQLGQVLEERPALAVLTAGTAASKTTTAVRLGAVQPGRIVWNVGSHAAAAAIVDAHHTLGHTDAAAMPPRDETTCVCWTAADVERVARAHGVRPGPSMERAMAVGAPVLACNRCPLSPTFRGKRGAVPTPDMALAAHAPVDDAALLDEFTAPDSLDRPTPAAELDELPTSCRYWERVAEAEAARILVQCQQRTERRPESVAGEGWEHVTVFSDENANAVLNPRVCVNAEELDTVANVLSVAAHNARRRQRNHRSHDAWKRAHAMPDWADTLAGVATSLATWAREQEAAGVRAVLELPDLAVDAAARPKHGTTGVLELLARDDMPESFKPEALAIVRMVAEGAEHNTRLLVAEVAGGGWYASFHRSWKLELPAGVCHVALDATANVEALRLARPDALVLEPPGAAANVKQAMQWWHEINGNTSLSTAVAWVERALDAMGWQSFVLVLPKRLRRLLFPQTRPRGGRVPMDKPIDVAALAAHMGRAGGGPETLERRMAAARELAKRVQRFHARMARDANGNLLVEHHRGTRARGSNSFMAAAGVDGFLVLGHQRTNPVDIAGGMLAIGQVAEVLAGSQWADVAGELPHVDGTTRTVRWRGYVCPVWAAMARALNRADLEQTAARARPTLDKGVPLLVIAAEPCGLPLADPPAVLPAGVDEVVAAVRELAARPPAGPGTGADAPGGGVAAPERTPDVGKMGGFVAGPGRVESGHRPIGHTTGCVLIGQWPDSPGVARAAIVAALGAPERTVKRWLATAVATGALVVSGAGPATRYRLPRPADVLAGPPPAAPPAWMATGVAEPATVDVVRWPAPAPSAPVGDVGDVGGFLAGAPPAKTPAPEPPPAEIVPAVPHPREPKTPETGTGRRPTKRKTPDTAGARAHDAEPTGGLPRYRLPHNAPKLTGQARDAMVAELRQHLRAVAFNARVDHMAGNDRDDLAVDELVALFGEPPPAVARGP